jgi:hypothetical protein
MKNGYRAGCQGYRAKNDFGLPRENILAMDLNLKPRFKSKSNTFSNSNKFKSFLKVEIWDF